MFSFILLALSTWRMSSMVRDESGPYDMFGKLRESIGLIEIYDNGERELISNGTLLADIVSCFWCLSVWIGGIIAFLAVILGLISWQEFLYYALASSATAILIEEKVF
jgi:hypothetical protein